MHNSLCSLARNLGYDRGRLEVADHPLACRSALHRPDLTSDPLDADRVRRDACLQQERFPGQSPDRSRWPRLIWFLTAFTGAALQGIRVTIRCPGCCQVSEIRRGFSAYGNPLKDSVKFVVLYTSGAEADWPDALDPFTGSFTYFGDNRSPGRELHDTLRRGNLLLSLVFERASSGAQSRQQVPPFLLFDKPGTGRDVRFRGLLAPGSDRVSGQEDLVAVWRTMRGQRFQNYRAQFTVLDVPSVLSAWLDQVKAGKPLGAGCPAGWKTWTELGTYTPLLAPSTVVIRSRDEQQPANADKPVTRSSSLRAQTSSRSSRARGSRPHTP